ncbi:MAG TPA: hypothetical protein VGF17_05605, partial [Phytomonospora sp.]
TVGRGAMTRPRGRRHDRHDAVVTPLVSGTLAAAPATYAATGSIPAVLLLLAAATLIVALLVRAR